MCAASAAFARGWSLSPSAGVARDELRPGLRLAHFEKRVVAAFTITPDQVRIGRIFYGGQDYAALLGEEPEESSTIARR